jgi:hypothetical protein
MSSQSLTLLFSYRATVYVVTIQNYLRVFFSPDYSDLKQDQKRMEHFTSLYGVLIDFIGESNLPNTAELMGIYGRVSVKF